MYSCPKSWAHNDERVGRTMTRGNLCLSECASYLLAKYQVRDDFSAKIGPGGGEHDPKLRDLWEISELSANDFAEEVACFYGLPRLSLPELIAAQPLVNGFSRRFLRETMVFPYQGDSGFP